MHMRISQALNKLSLRLIRSDRLGCDCDLCGPTREGLGINPAKAGPKRGRQETFRSTHPPSIEKSRQEAVKAKTG